MEDLRIVGKSSRGVVYGHSALCECPEIVVELIRPEDVVGAA